jgi:hypothetical protein
MPLFEFKSTKTGEIREWIGSYKNRPEVLYDPDTGEAFKLKMSCPNLITSNLSSWTEGLSHTTYYDKNLQTTIYGEAHKERVLTARGLVREKDLPKNFIADKMEANLVEQKIQDDESNRFFDNMKEFGLDKQGENTGERIKAQEKFWEKQLPLGDLCNNPEKYSGGDAN